MVMNSTANVSRSDRKPVMNLRSARDRLGGDELLLRDLVRFFVEDSPGLMEELSAGLRADDADRIQRAAHNLKGLAANFDGAPCESAAFAIEQAARDRHLGDVPPLLETLRVEIERLAAALMQEKLS